MSFHLTGMKSRFSRLPFILLAISILAYGLLISRLGFAWDDLLAIWIRYHLGAEAMSRCFAISRPVLGWFFQMTTAILPPIPAYWHIFAIFWRWAGAVTVWGLLRNLWTKKTYLAWAVSLLFLVYPGFSQQFVSYTYSHYFFILFCYLFSLLVSIWSIRQSRLYWPLTILSLGLSAINLLTLEYFFMLELLRPLIIWFVLRRNSNERQLGSLRTLLFTLPYMGLFLMAILGRVFLFPNRLYSFTALDLWQTAPAAAFYTLLVTIAESLWMAVIQAWEMVFQFPAAWQIGHPWVYLGVAAAVTGLTIWGAGRPIMSNRQKYSWRSRFEVIALGTFALLLAGWPFWLIGFVPSLNFPNDRFTLPFMLGASLVIAGCLEFLPIHALKAGILGLLIGLAAGRQVVLADEFGREWDVQRNLFWQMNWRIPALEAGTLILMNDGVLEYYADNSLTAPLNWIYSTDSPSGQMDYLLFHPRSRLGGSLPALKPGLDIHYTIHAADFYGNTTQTLVMNFRPPGCLYLLDPELDPFNRSLHETMRTAAHFTNPDLILLEGDPLLPVLYYPEPDHDWCYYFQKASLAIQGNDWQEAGDLIDLAFTKGLRPLHPNEWLIIIESDVHNGNWERAQSMTENLSISVPHLGPVLCRLWQRIDMTMPDTAIKTEILNSLASKLQCLP